VRVPRQRPEIGLAYDVGGRGDQSQRLGVRRSEEGRRRPRRQLQEVEAGSGGTTRTRAAAPARRRGLQPVIAVGFILPAVATVAAEYPEVNFGVVDGYATAIKEQKNVADLTFAENEGSFLVGDAAALKTEAKNVGFVGGVNGPLIQKFEAGFKAGRGSRPSTHRRTTPQQGFKGSRRRQKTGCMTATGGHLPRRRQSGLGVFDAVEAAGGGCDRRRLRPVPHRRRGAEEAISPRCSSGSRPRCSVRLVFGGSAAAVPAT
jgi:basic membrane protein A